MSNEQEQKVRAALEAADAAVHSTEPVMDPAPEAEPGIEPTSPELQVLLDMPIVGDANSDAGLLNGLHAFILGDHSMDEKIRALAYMDKTVGHEQETYSAEMVEAFIADCQNDGSAPASDSEVVSTDPTPADPNTVGQAAVAIAEETKKQAAEKKPRRKPVKGVMAKARELLAAGEDKSVAIGYLKSMYLEGGRDEKNAMESAKLIVNDVYSGQGGQQQSS